MSGRDAARARATGGSVAVRQQGGPPTVRSLFEQMGPEIQRALPKHMDPDRMIRVALTVVNQSEKLKACKPESLLGALMTCTQIGLEPGPQGHVYFVPYGRDVTFILGYQGMIELARRSGLLLSIAAHTVYQNEVDADQFSVEYGSVNKLVHKPIIFGDRGEAVAYYATARIKSPVSDATEDVFVVLTRREVDLFRARSATQKADKPTGPWLTDYEAMAWKGLALDTPIPTPAGWTTMGTIEAGDEVFDVDGERTRVIAVSEVKHLDCYRVTLTNGDTITCDAEHEWVAGVGRNAARDGLRKRNIADLYAAKQAGKPVVFPVAGVLDTESTSLPVDPWLLGFWLGDGAARGAQLTVHRDRVSEVAEKVSAAGYEVGAIRQDGRSAACSMGVRRGLRKGLAELGVLNAKHVPAAYLRGSAAQRLALLQGLMDSDGTIDKTRGRAVFSSTDEQLAGAVAELVSSLGDTPGRAAVKRRGFGLTVLSHEVSWKPTLCPVTLADKAEKFRPRKVASYRAVRSIEKVPTVPTVCIGVDSESHTFLAGRSMVPTHNTCIRRLSRWLPQSPELAAAMSHEETVRTKISANVVDEAEPRPAEPFEGTSAPLEVMPADDQGADPATGEIPPGEGWSDEPPTPEPGGADDPWAKP